MVITNYIRKVKFIFIFLFNKHYLKLFLNIFYIYNIIKIIIKSSIKYSKFKSIFNLNIQHILHVFYKIVFERSKISL